MSTSVAPALAGDSLSISPSSSAAPRRRGRPSNGPRALSAAERMKLMRLRRTVKRGTKAKRVRWQHLTEEQAYDLQLRRQRARDRRHDKFLENLLKDAVASGRESLPTTDQWGAVMPGAPLFGSDMEAIADEGLIVDQNPVTSPMVDAEVLQLPAKKKSAVDYDDEEGEGTEVEEGDDTFQKKHFRDVSDLRCFHSKCRRLVWGVRTVNKKEVFHCNVHAPVDAGAEFRNGETL